MQNLHQSHYLDKHNILNKGNENNPKFYSNEIILFNTRQARDKKSIKNEITFIITNIILNLYKEYTSLKSRELEELPRFVVMIWQPFMLLRSASLCLFRITLCMQRYDFVSCKTKVS